LKVIVETRQFLNDPSTWLIGLLTSQTECSTALLIEQCRTTTRTYDDAGPPRLPVTFSPLPPLPWRRHLDSSQSKWFEAWEHSLALKEASTPSPPRLPLYLPGEIGEIHREAGRRGGER
jgi:hypothetical protein